MDTRKEFPDPQIGLVLLYTESIFDDFKRP